MANKVYQAQETIIDWQASGGTELLTLTSLATLTGRQGAMHDFGATARARRYAWRFFMKFSTAPIVGQSVDIYWKSAIDAAGVSRPDNDDGTGDIAVSAEDKLNNLLWIGAMLVDEAAVAVEMVASGVMDIPHQHGSPVVWNGTVDVFSTTAADMGFILTPIPLEVQ